LLIACRVCALLGFTWLYLAISIRLTVEDVCGSAVRAVVNDKATTIGSIGGSMGDARALAMPASAPAAAAGLSLSSHAVLLCLSSHALRCLCSDALLLSPRIGGGAFLLLLSSHIGLAAFFLRCCFLLT
jgi:hypothetical protein